MSRYNKTWDVNIVLQYLQSMDRATELSIKDLTLIKVSNANSTYYSRQRTNLEQTLLNLEGMVKEDSCIVFVIGSNVKQSRPASSLTERIVKLKANPFEEKLCVFHTCSVYIDKTSCLRGKETQLLLTHQKPHRRASRDSIRRWRQSVMQSAGVDVTLYKPHSVRSAAASKANHATLDEIMKTAGWSSAATFAKFYDKEIVSDVTFSDAVLGN